jgi:predicted transcriptional regulator
MTEKQRQNRQIKILKFLEDRPCISVKCIEEKSGIPLSTIGQAIGGKRDLPMKSIEKIIDELKKYGYK